MGESFAGEKGVEQFKGQLEAFISSHTGKSYNGHSEVRLILVSPVACEDLGKLAPARQKRNRELYAYTQTMQEVATDADVPFIDLFETSRYLMDEPVGPMLTSNGLHLKWVASEFVRLLGHQPRVLRSTDGQRSCVRAAIVAPPDRCHIEVNGRSRRCYFSSVDG